HGRVLERPDPNAGSGRRVQASINLQKSGIIQIQKMQKTPEQEHSIKQAKLETN
ncbi:hypothetical protein LDENG_00210700, partial [Lucifuga dentata]